MPKFLRGGGEGGGLGTTSGILRTTQSRNEERNAPPEGKARRNILFVGGMAGCPSRGHCVRPAGANRIWVTGTKAIISPRKVNKENTQSFTSATPRYLGGQAMRKLPKLGTKGRIRRVVNGGRGTVEETEEGD